jgi:hypothetical protein
MAATYGRTQLTKTGRDVEVIADGDYSRMKSGGVTLDVATIAAVAGAPATLTDDTVVPVGKKYLRFGQILARITATGLYGPFDPAAADGRQTLARGSCFLPNQTWLDDPGTGLLASSLHPAVFDGGHVWRDRLLITTGAASLAAGPTVAAFEAAFPEVSYAGF